MHLNDLSQEISNEEINTAFGSYSITLSLVSQRIFYCFILFSSVLPRSHSPRSESDSVHGCQVWLADLIPPDSNPV